mgnify:FL=1
MSSTNRSLSLFPLNVVLFPGSSLPITVFEERYKLMLQDCLNTGSKFGVVLIKSGSEVGEPAVPHLVGTVCKIIAVEYKDDGVINITVKGEERFSLIRLYQTKPYLNAEVETLDYLGFQDENPEYISMIQSKFLQYIRLMIGVDGGWIQNINLPSDQIGLACMIASTIQIKLSEKQSLLEHSNIGDLLADELSILDTENERLREKVALTLLSRFSVQ